MTFRRSFAKANLLHQSSIRVLLQEFMDSIAENSWPCEIQSTLDLPGESFSDHLQAPEQHGVLGRRDNKPLLELLCAAELDFCPLPLGETMSELVTNQQRCVLGHLPFCNGFGGLHISICIVASIGPEDQVPEDICLFHGCEAFPNGPNDIGRFGHSQSCNFRIVPQVVLTAWIHRAPGLCIVFLRSHQTVRFPSLVDDAWNSAWSSMELLRGFVVDHGRDLIFTAGQTG
eukprot:Skav230761  [mRNA]  locus=scaffold4515:145288:146106:- [translate_table: standard]